MNQQKHLKYLHCWTYFWKRSAALREKNCHYLCCNKM